MAEQQLPFMAHLIELRRRLVVAATTWFVAFLGCYYYRLELFHYISKPLNDALPAGSPVVFLSPTEPLFTHMKIAAVAAVLLAMPVILWQFWGFIAPALHRHEKRFAIPFVVSGCGCFLFGTYFGFTWIFPLIFKVLIQMGMEGGDVTPMITMGEYFSMAWKLLLAFGVIFEIPIVILIFARMGIIDHHWLKAKRKYMIVVAFIVGGVVTPGPDVLSQTALAIPFVILYEIGILLARFLGKEKAVAAAAAEPS